MQTIKKPVVVAEIANCHEGNVKYVLELLSKIKNANHFFKDKEKELRVEIEKYINEKTALI